LENQTARWRAPLPKREKVRKGHGDIVAREGLLEKRYFVLRATTSASNISLPIPGDESALADAPRGKRKIRNGVPWRSCSAYDSSLALTLSLSLSLSLSYARTQSPIIELQVVSRSFLSQTFSCRRSDSASRSRSRRTRRGLSPLSSLVSTNYPVYTIHSPSCLSLFPSSFSHALSLSLSLTNVLIIKRMGVGARCRDVLKVGNGNGASIP